MKRRHGAAVAGAAIGLAGLAAALVPAAAGAGTGAGAAFALTNAASGNRVAVYARNGSGGLVASGSVATGGRGSGAGLGSQGALVLSPDGSRLYAVNAGSGTLSVLGVSGRRLWREQIVRSGGLDPISVTAGGGRVYVLNAGGTPNVRGFRVTASGLRPITGAHRALSAADAGPAEVAINPAGTRLVVTNKTTSTIDTFAVRANGSLGRAVSQASNGATPFGFAFTPNGTAVVSDASQAPTSAATAYRFAPDGTLQSVSGPLQTDQLAACWVSTTPDGRWAFVSDAHSGTISTLRVSAAGRLSLAVAGGISASGGAGSITLDSAVTPSGRYLTVLVLNATPGRNALETFRIGAGGSLALINSASGLPASAAGVAVSR